jgi:hypothetical protein
MQEIQVKERPILFSGAMVQAILKGQKTQTRRVVKLPNFLPSNEWDFSECFESLEGTSDYLSAFFGVHGASALVKCPYGKPGDRLWVRETWANGWFGDKSQGEIYVYRADEELCGVTWKPSIYMPRAASRILLEVLDVHVQRLQDISANEAICEGICQQRNTESGANRYGIHVVDIWSHESATDGFRMLWDSINNSRGYGWDMNPWVWVVSFSVVK